MSGMQTMVQNDSTLSLKNMILNRMDTTTENQISHDRTLKIMLRKRKKSASSSEFRLREYIGIFYDVLC